MYTVRTLDSPLRSVLSYLLHAVYSTLYGGAHHPKSAFSSTTIATNADHYDTFVYHRGNTIIMGRGAAVVVNRPITGCMKAAWLPSNCVTIPFLHSFLRFNFFPSPSPSRRGSRDDDSVAPVVAAVGVVVVVVRSTANNHRCGDQIF